MPEPRWIPDGTIGSTPLPSATIGSNRTSLHSAEKLHRLIIAAQLVGMSRRSRWAREGIRPSEPGFVPLSEVAGRPAVLKSVERRGGAQNRPAQAALRRAVGTGHPWRAGSTCVKRS